MRRILFFAGQYAHPVGCLIVLSTHLVTYAIAGNSACPTFIRKAGANACTNRASTVYNASASANASASTSTSALG